LKKGTTIVENTENVFLENTNGIENVIENINSPVLEK
jgi:hypothetical protein